MVFYGGIVTIFEFLSCAASPISRRVAILHRFNRQDYNIIKIIHRPLATVIITITIIMADSDEECIPDNQLDTQLSLQSGRQSPEDKTADIIERDEIQTLTKSDHYVGQRGSRSVSQILLFREGETDCC